MRKKHVNKRRKNKVENNLLADLILFSFLIVFSIIYFYLDPSITGYTTFEITVADTTQPNITVNAPVNNSNFSYINITFNLTIGEDNLIQNVSIFGNWTGVFTINSTNSSQALANNITIFVINITQGRGFYLWSARVCDNSSNCNSSTNQTIFINRIPEITSINISNDNAANKSTGSLSAKFNFQDSDSTDSMILSETRWYNNSVEIIAFRNFTTISSTNLTAGDNWILSARVFDGLDWSAWYNSSGHSIQNNAAPTFTGTIPNRSWAEDTALSNQFDLTQYFSDPENDVLNYSVIGNKVINISIVNGLVSMSQLPDWFGTEYVVFRANDTNLTRDSNNITLEVLNVDESPLVSQQGGGNTRVISAIGLIAPAQKTIYKKDKIKIPLIIKNKGSSTLQGIKLSTQSSESKVITLLEKDSIIALSPGQEELIELNIVSDLNENKESIGITIKAQVTSPEITDSTKIYLNAVEFGASNKSVIIPRLEYVKDLFAKNEDCQNLNQLVKQAEELLSINKLNEAQSLIDKAINGCTDLIVLEPKRLEVSNQKINKKLILAMELIILSILTASLLVYFKKRKNKYI